MVVADPHLPNRHALTGPTRQVNMTRFPLVDLYFAQEDAPPRLCCEITGLAEDEIEVLLVALKSRFDELVFARNRSRALCPSVLM